VEPRDPPRTIALDGSGALPWYRSLRSLETQSGEPTVEAHRPRTQRSDCFGSRNRGVLSSFACVALALTLCSITEVARAKASRQSSSGFPLSAELSLDHHRKLLNSGSEADRLLGLSFLARLGTNQSLNALNGAVTNVVTRGTLLEGRTLIELLFEHVSDPQSLHSLLRIVTGAAANNKAGGVHPFLRAAAAMALAQSDSVAARAALSQALHGDKESAEHAAAALLAHPPTALDFLATGSNPNVTLARLLGDLGDQRAFPVLRAWIRVGTTDVQNEAALSLTRLGAYETTELARHWLQQTPSLERQRTATEILLIAGSSDSEAALLDLARHPKQTATFMALALRFPSAGVVEPILARLDSASVEELPSLISILGRAGTAKAVTYLGQALVNPRFAELASFALGQCTAARAADEVRRALGDERKRPWALRAALLRKLHFDESNADLKDDFETLARSNKSAETALGVWGLSALDGNYASQALESTDPIRSAAAARTALLQNESFFITAAHRLAKARSEHERFLFSFALLDDHAGDEIPTESLLLLASKGAAYSPLAAYALARRADPELRALLSEFLNASSTALRAHTALGLGQSRDPGATALLVSRYRRELDWRVRWAIVTGLGRRHELLRTIS
jgi:HEAT repeat protein